MVGGGAGDLDLVTRDTTRWRAHFPSIRAGASWVGSDLESDFEGRVARRVVGDSSVSVLTVRGHAHAIVRTSAQVGTVPDPFVLAAVQLSGTSRLETVRGTALLRPGDHLVATWTTPSRWAFPGEFTLFIARMPAERLRAALTLPDAPVGQVLPGRAGVGVALLPFVASLAENLDLLRGRGGPRVLAAVADLFSASLVARASEEAGRGIRSARADTFDRATAWIDGRPQDPALGVETIAVGLAVSRRHLQAAFAERGETVTGWIRRRRLEGAAAALEDPALGHRSIEAIAREWGFAHASYFARSFRAQYGCTPGGWRRGVVSH